MSVVAIYTEPFDALARYERARKALAEAHRVDEAKDIRDKAVAMQVYARQANDTELIGYATGIRLRAERRAGELLAEMAKAKGTRGQLRGDVLVGGRAPTPPTETTPTLKDMGVTKTQSSKWQKLAKLPEDKFEAKVAALKTKAENSTTSAPRHTKPIFSGEFEWYTPQRYVDLARSVLGNIDVDPASSHVAQNVVKADRYYTIETNGLDQEWYGRVWLNPPYAQPYITNFMTKMVEEVSSGNVTEAIMLTNNFTDTEWFHTGLKHCAAVCFTTGRIKFYDPEGNVGPAPTRGQAFFYFGNCVSAFKEAFAQVGFVVTP
jgi:phage N-6-adenine-methyltransferase